MEKDLIEYIAGSLVENPGTVSVNAVDEGRSTILELRVCESDLGKVIGKRGRIAKAIRTVLQATTTKSGKRISLEILD